MEMYFSFLSDYVVPLVTGAVNIAVTSATTRLFPWLLLSFGTK
ncbi:hypothetical protein HMPREF1548_04759 [Clostridium sp. KLE 1755]|nr:hypothetical protein HMPREF1548_04759 [Clostridium sp. KLE 1755]